MSLIGDCQGINLRLSSIAFKLPAVILGAFSQHCGRQKRYTIELNREQELGYTDSEAVVTPVR